MSIGREDYQERKEARIDRMEERAAHAQAESTAASHAAHEIMRLIPPGQPILVGHHSERHHRRDMDDERAAKIDAALAEQDASPYSSGKHSPVPAYVLSNRNGEIKRIKDRLAQLRKVDEMEHTEIEFDGGMIITNEDVNRVQILFDEKPDDTTRSKLKSNGFRWSRTEGAWQTQRTPQSLHRACYLLGIDPPKPAPAPTAADENDACQDAAPLATPEEAPPLELPAADDGQALFPLA